MSKDLCPQNKLRFSCMVTIGDWAYGYGTWGRIGVARVLSKIRDAGFAKVYWRSCGGSGTAMYPSRITNSDGWIEPYDPEDPDRYPEHPLGKTGWGDWTFEFLKGGKPLLDYSSFDALGEARDISRKLGLEFAVWHEHAEDHGGMGAVGRMALLHPEWFTLNRDGKRSHCRFSMAIPAAMEYRIAWVREVLAYEPDAVYFDFAKSMEGTLGVGITPHFDDNGVWYCGYDDAHVEAFKRKTGRDPFKIPNDDEEWVRFRAGYMTEFLQRVRQLQKTTYPQVKLGLFGTCRGRMGTGPSDQYIPLNDPLLSYLEDQKTWTGEGLLDEFVNNYGMHGSDDVEQIKATIVESRARVKPPCRYLGTQLEVYSVKSENEKLFMDAAQAAIEAGCEEITFFESHPLESNNTWEAARKAIKQFGA